MQLVKNTIYLYSKNKKYPQLVLLPTADIFYLLFDATPFLKRARGVARNVACVVLCGVCVEVLCRSNRQQYLPNGCAQKTL